MIEKIKKVLIANRGEVTCRIARTLKQMGIKSVAIYTENDANAFFIYSADENIMINSKDGHSGYLDQDAIILAAKTMGVDAIHPGFGFLSENHEFAKNVRKNNLSFIGPSEEAIRIMGDKLRAKAMAIKANVNTIPGFTEPITSVRRAMDVVNKIGGYPVMIKAAAGGGGKGIRIARNDNELEQSFDITIAEAQSSFKSGSVFIEKFIENPHHIEIQVVADKHGNVVCLGERECSIQRRYQKIIEETPSVLIDNKTRDMMYEQCVALAKLINYYSVGTVEFVVNDKREFFFLEMNTRLQVEHTITEMVTDLDIVKLMVNIEEGYPIGFEQNEIKFSGAAIEARIYAEDPENNFAPSTGKITTYLEPTGDNVRIETGVTAGSDITPYYDPMIVKLCAHGRNRAQAITNLQNAMSEFVIDGPDLTSNMVFIEYILRNRKFLEGDTCTNFVDTECSPNKYSYPETGALNIMFAVLAYRFDVSNTNCEGRITLVFFMHGRQYTVQLEKVDDMTCIVTIDDWRLRFDVLESSLHRVHIGYDNGKSAWIKVKHPRMDLGEMGYYASYGGHYVVCRIFESHVGELFKFMPKPKLLFDDPRMIISQMSGMVVKIFVSKGDAVRKGDRLLCVEAMKMQNVLYAKSNAIVDEIKVSTGTLVSKGDILMTLTPSE